MNWGRGLTLFIVGFILAMLGMVYIAFKQSNEMIEDNYYDREVKYQEIIDAKSNLNPYSANLSWLIRMISFF
jgi:regulatory protein YycI of two-component signal transduction system YycFG